MDKLASILQAFLGGMGSRKIAGIALMMISVFWKDMPADLASNPEVLNNATAIVGMFLTLFGQGAAANKPVQVQTVIVKEVPSATA